MKARLRLPVPHPLSRRIVQAQPAERRLEDYLAKREIVRSVPPRGAMAIQPGAGEALQAKPAPGLATGATPAESLARKMDRARRLGHRITGILPGGGGPIGEGVKS